MKLLEEAGIYVFTEVSTRFNAINRIDPYNSYHGTAMTEFFQTVNIMAQYPNTLGLLAGVGLVNSKATEKAAPVVKAVVRDLKRYMKLQNIACGQRILPIGYTAATLDQLDTAVLDYVSLGDPASSIDFWTVSLALSLDVSTLTLSDSATATCGQGNLTCMRLATKHW